MFTHTHTPRKEKQDHGTGCTNQKVASPKPPISLYFPSSSNNPAPEMHPFTGETRQASFCKTDGPDREMHQDFKASEALKIKISRRCLMQAKATARSDSLEFKIRRWIDETIKRVVILPLRILAALCTVPIDWDSEEKGCCCCHFL